MEGKNKLLVHKWDFFCKHVGCKKANGNMANSSDVKEKLHIIPKHVSLPRSKKPLLHAIGRMLVYDWHVGWWKKTKKVIQFAIFLHLL